MDEYQKRQLIESAPKYSIPMVRKEVQELTQYLIEDCRFGGDFLAGAVFDELLETLIKVMRFERYTSLDEEYREDIQQRRKAAVGSILNIHAGEELTKPAVICIAQKIIIWRVNLDRGIPFTPWMPGDRPEWAAVKVQEVRRVANTDGYRYCLYMKAFSSRACGQEWVYRCSPAGIRRIGYEIGFPKYPDKPTNPYDISGMWFTTLLGTANGRLVMDLFTRSSSMISVNRKLLQGRQGKCLLKEDMDCFHCPLGRDQCWLARVMVTATEQKKCMNYTYGDQGQHVYHEGIIEDNDNQVCYVCMQGINGQLNKEVRGIT